MVLAPSGAFVQDRTRPIQSKRETTMSTEPAAQRQLLHLVFGGELKQLDTHEFRDPSALDVVGIFPSYTEAHSAWKAAAQRTVDNAQMRYFIVHMHRLLDPDPVHKYKDGE